MTQKTELSRVPWYRGRYFALLASLLLLFVLPIFRVPEATVDTGLGEGRPVLLSIVFSAIMVSAVFVAQSRRRLIIALVLLVPALAGTWVGNEALRDLFWSIFLIYVIAILFGDLLGHRRVTVDTLFGGIALYLLLGLLWSGFYGLLVEAGGDRVVFSGLHTEAQLAESDSPHPSQSLVYFSFVTLTTLGYGDITPKTAAARALCSLEAVVGQLYVAVFIAGLLGIHLAQRIEDRTTDAGEAAD